MSEADSGEADASCPESSSRFPEPETAVPEGETDCPEPAFPSEGMPSPVTPHPANKKQVPARSRTDKEKGMNQDEEPEPGKERDLVQDPVLEKK